MSIISLALPSNVLHDQPQVLEFDKIATFIGSNGSGKSTILKSIFDEKLNGTTYQNYKIVCFSSGQNESYSDGFSKYLNEERAKKNALNLDCFYYDKLWAMLLIFLATTSKQDGYVRTFLKEYNYISENAFEEDESTQLSFNIKVDKSYTNLVKQSFEDEKKGESDIVTNKAYYRTLNNFIKSLVRDDYDFSEPLESQNIQLNQDKLSMVSFEEEVESSFDSKVMFFTQAADNNYFIVKDSFTLVFKKDNKSLYLSDLSDGEYQLLFLYSLIDLFDSENTIFLLDEADSHLHYKNIDKLWRIYLQVQGLIITTTHLVDSITKSGIERLKVIENGQIKSGKELNHLTNRLRELSEINNVKFQAISLFENIILMDDENDWEQFKLLVKRKLANSVEELAGIEKKLSNFLVIKCNSGFEGKGNEKFADKKLSWLRNFLEYLNGHTFITKNIFLICDRDELPLANVGTQKCTLLIKGDNIITNPKSHLLSWRRREIKHYLLSYTALFDEISTIESELDLGTKSKLLPNNSGDYKTCGNYNEKLATIKSDIVKDIVNPYINIENGFCVEKAKAYIDRIPKDEISEDIVNMYNYLVGENE
jgi:ABC-type cobalamin/Fe3+-siderophores transport system ATPase subunit